ncbi:hypothetical protein FPOAC2_07251 [Fusarium poae]|jgi:hypothetical protein
MGPSLSQITNPYQQCHISQATFPKLYTTSHRIPHRTALAPEKKAHRQGLNKVKRPRPLYRDRKQIKTAETLNDAAVVVWQTRLVGGTSPLVGLYAVFATLSIQGGQ